MLAEKKLENTLARKSLTMADIAIVVLLFFSYLPGLLFYGFNLHVIDIIAIVQTLLVCGLLFLQYTTFGTVLVNVLRKNRWVFIWIFVGIYTSAIGLVRNREFIGWIYSDLYRYFIVPIIVGLIMGAKKSFNIERIVELLAEYEIGIALVEIFAVLSGHYPRTSNMMHILFPYALAVLLLRGKRGSSFWIIGFTIELVRIALSLSRTLLLETVGFLILIPFLLRQKVAVKRIGILSFFILVLIGIGQLLISPLVPLEKYKVRIVQLGDISIEGRVLEAQTALAYLYNQGSIAMLLGTGAGSVYYLPEIMLFAGSERYEATSFQVHNIHIGPVSVLFRTGIVGLILIYTPLVFIPVKLMFKVAQPIGKVIGAFLLFKTLESIQALRLVGDPFLLVILAYANHEFYFRGRMVSVYRGFRQTLSQWTAGDSLKKAT